MQGQLVRVAIYVWMDWNEGMKEGKHQLRQVSYPMGLASDHKRRDWTQVGKAGSQPISPIKQASESTGFLSFSSGIGPEKERAAKLERLAQRSDDFLFSGQSPSFDAYRIVFARVGGDVLPGGEMSCKMSRCYRR